MCTLLTVNRDTFLADKRDMVSRILNDAQMNPDGFSLIAVDPLAPYTNFHLNSMAVGSILNMLENFMNSCSEYSRIWLHTRAATTDFVGVPFNHGFTDSRGTMIQHNGIVYNYRALAVDSFNLVDYRTDTAQNLRDDLQTSQEYFANIFLIRPDLNTYGVVRMASGSLFTDHKGNYSTRPVGDINRHILMDYAREHSLIKSSAAPAITPATKLEYSFPMDDEEPIDRQSVVNSVWDEILDKKAL